MKGRSVAAAIVFALVMLGASPVAGAANPTITGHGDVHCAGGVKFKVFLSGKWGQFTEPRSWYHTDIVLKSSTLSCTGTTGNGAVVVRKAKVTGSFTNWGVGVQDTVIVCNPITGVAGSANLTVQWKASGGAIKATQIHYSNSFYKIGNPRVGDPYALQAPSPTAPVGTSSVTGSYAGTGSSHAIVFDTILSFAVERSCTTTPVMYTTRTGFMAFDV